MPKKNAQPSVSSVAGVQREVGAGEQEQPDGRDHDRERARSAAVLCAVTTVSTSGVNTTNRPVMKAEFDVVVRSSPAFWNQ